MHLEIDTPNYLSTNHRFLALKVVDFICPEKELFHPEPELNERSYKYIQVMKEQREERIKDIESIRIESGRRTYFIGAIEPKEGDRYLKITQRTLKENNDVEYDKIFIYKETLEEICSALSKVLKHLTIKSQLFSPEIQSPPISDTPKIHKPWNAKEDLKLEKLYCKRKTIDELIVILERSNSDIEARIQKLGLEEKYDFNDLD